MPAARRRPRAALYHRASTREQNPRLARSELRAAATTRALGIVLEVEETGSGRGRVRPGLDRVLGAAQRGAERSTLSSFSASIVGAARRSTS